MQRSHKNNNNQIAKYLSAYVESNKPSQEVVYMARAIVTATLPHSKSKENIFIRKNGNYTLTITANPAFGLPYGSIPRMLLAWLTTEVVINKENPSPEIELGDSFNSFLKKLKLRSGGGERGNSSRVRDQLIRLLSCSISSVYHDQAKGVCQSDQFHISRSFNLWWNPLSSGNKEILPKSKITLAKDFFDELIKTAIPVDCDALNLLRRSPLQIDIYVWLTYRFFNLKKETLIPWQLLQNQFGSDYADNAEGKRNFKKKFLQALNKVWAVYPDANATPNQKGLVLFPSNTHVKQKYK